LWAGLVVLLNQKLSRPLGFVNAALYAITPPNGLRDITQGNNGAFSAGPGWDACTGKGTPVAGHLLQALDSSGFLAASSVDPRPAPAVAD
jgi:kumamolisin